MTETGKVEARCVVLADRHAGLVEGLRNLLSSMFDAVIMVADESSLMKVASSMEPTVAVMDVSLVQGDGLAWLKRFRSRCPGSRVVILTGHDDESVRRAVLRAGADAVVVKGAIATDLLPVLDALGYDPGPGRHPRSPGAE